LKEKLINPQLKDCSIYWQHSDYLPLDAVVTYWCESSGFDAAHCREAKRSAICSAIEKKLIKFRRNDGLTFQDDVHELASRGILQIEKDSFNIWIEQFADAPVIDEPLSAKERGSLLVMIAVLCKEAKLEYKTPSKTAKLILDMAYEMGVSIGETTIENNLKKIPDALERRMK
jgi:hypothetical protein